MVPESPPALTYHVYVLWSAAARKFYIGLTNDLDRRLAQHNNGESRWTRNRGPWALVWTSPAQNLHAARCLERHLKNQHGGKGFFQITGLDPERFDRPSGS